MTSDSCIFIIDHTSDVSSIQFIHIFISLLKTGKRAFSFHHYELVPTLWAFSCSSVHSTETDIGTSPVACLTVNIVIRCIWALNNIHSNIWLISLLLIWVVGCETDLPAYLCGHLSITPYTSRPTSTTAMLPRMLVEQTIPRGSWKSESRSWIISREPGDMVKVFVWLSVDWCETTTSVLSPCFS